MLELELNKIYQGNSLDILKTFPDLSINCCVTSPPYWGLRNYQTTGQIWGGDKNCSHEWSEPINCPTKIGTQCSTETIKNINLVNNMNKPKGTMFCNKCNAWLGELGLEPSPNKYVEHLIKIFNEVKRVLKDDGTLWLNIGDTYSKKEMGLLKSKDLIGIPWMVAFALRDIGWYLRSDIIWERPNAMPSSVKDRPTTSHEYIFLLSKSKKYYYDIDAIREPLSEVTKKRDKYTRKTINGKTATKTEYSVDHLHNSKSNSKGRNKRTVWSINTKPFKGGHFACFPPDLIKPCIFAGCPERGIVLDPFMGAGTTGLVCKELNRNYIGIELNSEYIKIAEERIKNTKEKIICLN